MYCEYLLQLIGSPKEYTPVSGLFFVAVDVGFSVRLSFSNSAYFCVQPLYGLVSSRFILSCLLQYCCQWGSLLTRGQVCGGRF